jgi:predicted glycoside hydrolase/deacetylase ChbG (UPF0249 family)
MPTGRYLVVTADDFGIGPGTSNGILDLALDGRVTATVLLVNSPYAEAAVRAWRQTGCPVELGWHPALTLDRPVLSPGRVPTLVDSDGAFHRLGPFLRRLMLGQIARKDLAAELCAQWQRFHDLVGHAPTVVNAHHHVHIFPPVGDLLCDLLARQTPRPYLRRICEPLRLLQHLPGARVKRAVLTLWGRCAARRQLALDLPGNEWLAGISDLVHPLDADFFRRWVRCIPGRYAELTCHPGYVDPTLLGRDATPTDGMMARRVDELRLLQQASFLDECAAAGFQLVSPSQPRWARPTRRAHAA